ncbi:MAG: phosphodiester glycosidase family protein [Muribaculaceae bacterium]|nr:phosphodiester glycosidase family protein [Muribaculaceae bacterium]
MKIYPLALALLAFLPAQAGTSWTIQYKAYQVDTLYHATVGPGTTQTSLHLSGGSNLDIFYTVTDLTNPNVEMRVAMANDKYAACATVSSMAKNHSTETEQYFAGVNADFFGNQAPVGSTVVNKEIYNLANNGWTTWAMVNRKTPVANEMSFNGSVASGSASHKLSGVNVTRYENYMVIYTNRKGSTSGTNVYGSEVALQPVSGTLVSFGKNTYKVTSAPSSAGSMAIPAGQVVLSGNGTAADFVKSLSIGDEVTVDITLINGSESYTDVSQMAGGKPMIVSGGKVLNTQGALDHLTSLNPRTAIGFDPTGTKLVLLVVDGRGASVGVVSRQLADIMIQLGCTEAMNFDGGGSSALYVKEMGVRNKPSDGSERAVTNGVYAVAVAPVDNEVATIEFEQKHIALPRYCYYSPRIYAFNKYGVLIDTDYKGYTLSCSDELGTVTAEGNVLFTNGSGYHALKATANGASATIPVEVSKASPRMRLGEAIIDQFNPYSAEVVAEVQGSDVPVANTALTWTSDNPSIATVNEAGVISAVAEGQTIIRAEIDDIKLELPVKAQIPTSRYLSIHTPETTFKTAKSGVKDITVENDGKGGFSTKFTISSTRKPYLEVQAEATTFAIPDSLRLVVNPGSAKISSVYLMYTNLAGRTVSQPYTVDFPNDENSVMLIPVADIADKSIREVFPLRLNGLRFYLGNANATTHTITVPSYSFVYDNIKDEDGVESVIDNATSKLTFSPNPVERGAVVTLSAEAAVSIYTLAGAKVAETYGNSFTAPATPGIYIVKAGKLTGKLIVK